MLAYSRITRALAPARSPRHALRPLRQRGGAARGGPHPRRAVHDAPSKPAPTAPPAPPPAPAPAKPTEPHHFFGIPGPGWLQTTGHHLVAPLRAYDRASQRRPYVTQFLTSLVIYFCGDLSSQYISHRGDPDAAYDPASSARACTIGGLSSIPAYMYFIYLSTHFGAPSWVPFAGVVSTFFRVALMQFTFAPVFNCYFFGMQSLLSGAGAPAPADVPAGASAWERLGVESRLESARDRIVHTVPVSWVNSWKFWPFVTFFSFSFVPIRQRAVFSGLCAVVWQTYLGIVNLRHAKRDEAPAAQAVPVKG